MSAWPSRGSVGPREQRSNAARCSCRPSSVPATTAVHREGPHVVMATIAADMGVGIRTLYNASGPARICLAPCPPFLRAGDAMNVQAAGSDGATSAFAAAYLHQPAAIAAERTPSCRCMVGVDLLQPRKPWRCATRSTAPCKGSSNAA